MDGVNVSVCACVSNQLSKRPCENVRRIVASDFESGFGKNVGIGKLC